MMAVWFPVNWSPFSRARGVTASAPLLEDCDGRREDENWLLPFDALCSEMIQSRLDLSAWGRCCLCCSAKGLAQRKCVGVARVGTQCHRLSRAYTAAHKRVP